MIPLYPQEKDNTCALACLRMILSAFGREVEESALRDEADLEPHGTGIGEVARLARRFGLVADAEEVIVEDLRALLAGGALAITYIDRAIFDLPPRRRAGHSLREARIHTVVPTRITTTAITYHDPLPPARIVRRSLRLFRSAYERLGSHCVICPRPAEG